jgi:hypothetical protein
MKNTTLHLAVVLKIQSKLSNGKYKMFTHWYNWYLLPLPLLTIFLLLHQSHPGLEPQLQEHSQDTKKIYQQLPLRGSND